MTKKQDAERAVEIRSQLDSAVAYLRSAVVAVAEAELHAGLDFDHNQDALNDALGGLRLVQNAVVAEQIRWHDYAEARTVGGV